MSKETNIPFLGDYLTSERPKAGQTVKLVADNRVYHIVAVYPSVDDKWGLLLEDHSNGITVEMEVNRG
ncbi:hypothetical protein QE320_gp101 [Pseudomonas phage EM]|uniref:Uncharacterized protein n=1 Tax=Pseudomonas phage EM TaxID=2936914 RepID=A0AAE9HIB9_9CAUD|nr:hypothetical protein QE320_gp101 [Pseudomonas phage EM]UPW35953.1 hypothetical protein EM_168 [Pseudomonas phage EM]